ncbi:glycosyltransferase 61 family protein [Pseudacidovorax intermedius]|nr:glycosyltransferase 61 family protein [Pseudacidovorax intermedius]
MKITPDRLATQEFRYRNPLTYPRIELSELAGHVSNAIHVIREAGPYPEVTNRAAFHDRAERPVCPDLDVPLPSPRPAVFVMVRNDVALSGYRTLIGADGEYNLDEAFTSKEIEAIEIGRLGHPEQFRNELIGFRDTSEPGVYRLDASAKKFVTIDETVICLSSNEAPNYGAFLFRIFPKIIEIARLQVNLRILVPMYFPTLRQYLLMAGISEHRLIPQYLDHVYLIKRALVPSIRNRDVWLDDETLAFYDQLRLRHGSAQRDRKIYLSRRDFAKGPGANGRVMVNEGDLLPRLAEREFEVVEPQHFNAFEQIRLFSSASVLLSASGSAFFNVVFCYPGTKMVDIESEPHWVHGHARLFSSRGLEYGFFEGVPSSYEFSKHHVPFTVDVDALMRRLDSFL